MPSRGRFRKRAFSAMRSTSAGRRARRYTARARDADVSERPRRRLGPSRNASRAPARPVCNARGVSADHGSRVLNLYPRALSESGDEGAAMHRTQVELRASVEVFDDLVGSRPLLRRDDQVDIAPPEPVERAIRDATRIQTHRSELIAPRQRRLLVLERSDRLPALEARIADRHGRFLGDAALHEARERHRPSVAVRSRRSASR